MAIVRLKEVGPQSMTLTTDAHESSMTLYTFLKSSASSTDRAIAMREFKRHAARHSESGHTGPLSLLYHGNGRMVALCEEAVHDVLLRTTGSSHSTHDSPDRRGGPASRRRTMHERNPSIALEKDTWRHFLLHAAPTSQASSPSRPQQQASVDGTPCTDAHAEEVQRLPAASHRQAIEDHIRAMLADNTDGTAAARADQVAQPVGASPPRNHVTAASRPAAGASPPEVRIQPLADASTPHRTVTVPQPIVHVMEDVADAFASNPTASNTTDLEELAAASNIEARIVALRTRLTAAAQQGPGSASSATTAGSKRLQFVTQLLDRLHNVQQLHTVQRHEQDTLDLTANALRTENAALTKMLRALLAVMTRAELRLEQRGHAETEVEAAEGLLLSELHSILDDAADVSQERSQ